MLRKYFKETIFSFQELGLINRYELITSITLTISAWLLFYTLFGLHDPVLLMQGDNVWFQADLRRVFHNMIDKQSVGHYRVKVHPLFTLQTYPFVIVLIKIGFSALQAVKLFCASVAALWVLAIYLLFRVTGCLRIDAVLLTFLAISSSAAVFWLSVPESYALGSISIILCLILVALNQYHNQPTGLQIAVNGFSLSVTVTNWMFGVLSSVSLNHWKKALNITIISFAVVTFLWGIEKAIFPSAVFFLGDREESHFLFFPSASRIFNVISVFLSHTLIMPEIHIDTTSENTSGWAWLTIQKSFPGSLNPIHLLGVCLWSILLALGVWSSYKNKQHKSLKMVLAISLCGQLGLHILYGEETFLYALHFLPLLLTISAFALLGSLRLPTRYLIAVLIPIIAVNNWQQFQLAKELALSPRSNVKRQMALRSDDPWPRGHGHVILASPNVLPSTIPPSPNTKLGKQESNKAYYEPGGGFSPNAGSFGVSIWIKNLENKLLETSDSIQLNTLSQEFLWPINSGLPKLKTSTPFYKAVWQKLGWGSWQLDISDTDKNLATELVIRSVGPAGGPINKLEWDSEVLTVNNRWLVQIYPKPKSIFLGEETNKDWKSNYSDTKKIMSPTGWGVARFAIADPSSTTLIIKDKKLTDEVDLISSPIAPELKLSLPDDRFTKSLNAQIAHIMMGLVGNETRPGDPINYPLPWLRDGAYVLVALIQAGQLDKSKELAKYFAERDFFGGFGPEADAPGLAIWALTALADQLHSEDYDRWLWPHIFRKANYIEKMLGAEKSIYEKVMGPIVPGHINDSDLTLVAEKAKDGLIIGKMDHHRPILFINAVSFQGLTCAAKLAKRLGQANDAKHWSETAEKIQSAWQEAFVPPQSDNQRTYISALWPTWIAADMREKLQNNLVHRWNKVHEQGGSYKENPLWTYFNIAEAHQWLFLGDQRRVWDTLYWFWDHQSSPGLYTWWEGDGEENSFGIWANIRGSVNPTNVTPHYWTAAEMALLQMDMMCYIDKSNPEEILVIGSGVPDEWMQQKMTVIGLRLGESKLDWDWDGNKIKVTVHGKKLPVKLGGRFPSNTQIDLTYANL